MLLDSEKEKHWLSMQLRRFTFLTKSYFPYIYDENESKNIESLFVSLIHNPVEDVHDEFLKKNSGDATSLMLPISKVNLNNQLLFKKTFSITYSITDPHQFDIERIA